MRGRFGHRAVSDAIFQSKRKMQFGELLTPGLLGWTRTSNKFKIVMEKLQVPNKA